MCGIAGLVKAEGRIASGESFDSAARKLQHRGPDDTRIWVNEEQTVGLVHTRLAIIDLQTGQQPISNENEDVHVIFNGEIYNHVELRTKLECQGHQFKTQSDTEVLVHLYEQEGVGMFEHLNGMFAFAIWDERRGELLLARDRLGQKPLFFAQTKKGTAFASEIPALAALSEAPLTLDPAAVFHYLTFQYVPGNRCAFQGIEKLRPGEWLRLADGKIQRGFYWRPPVLNGSYSGTFEQACGELRRLLVDATRIRLRSDVPLGVLLSGGLDSAAVVGLMSEAGASPIRTYTACFPDGEDERPFANAVAQKFATDHTTLAVEEPDRETADKVMTLYAEPFADTSALPTYLICQLARRHVKVVLTGDGGDESFLGYERYRQFAHYLVQRRWLHPLLTLSGLNRVGRWICPSPGPRTWRRRFRTLTTLWDPEPAEVYERWLAAFSPPLKNRLCRPALADSPHGRSSSDEIRQGLSQRYQGDWVSAAAAYDLETYLPGAVLTKVDRASMAHGLECRSPFLDFRVVEFLATLPASWKLHPRHGSKWILRCACRDLLPESVARRGKVGFGAPVGEWIRRENSEDLEATCLPHGLLCDWINADVVAELIEEHLEGRVDHSYRLWTLACLGRAAT